MLGKKGKEEKGMTEGEMVGWHHRLSGREFGQTPGDSEGWESLVCCSPWGRRLGHESVTGQQKLLSKPQEWVMGAPIQ